MSELVDKQAVLKIIREMPCIIIGEKEALLDAVKGLPTVEPSQGHWDMVQQDRWIYAKCSECGKVSDAPTPYCSYCGARNGDETE